MATGDVPNILARLRALLPPWFPNQGSAPVLDGVLTGIATTLAFVYSLYAYAILQTRIRTASGAFIDLIAWDFFGGRFTRNPGESDASWGARVAAELIRTRVTRAAIQSAVAQLTGYPVRIIEGWLPNDVGVIDGIYLDVDIAGVAPGRVGDPALRCQFLLECVLPLTEPFGNNATPAIDTNLYLDTPPTGFIMDISSLAPTGIAAVYALINSLRAAGVTCWVRFVPIPTTVLWDQPGATWDQPGVAWDR